jgi:hypothetical protein
MPGEVQKLSTAQEDGASSAALSLGSAPGEGAGFKVVVRVGAMSRRRLLL